MKYTVFSNSNELSKNVESKIIDFLTRNSNFIYDNESPELVISVGGDGCMLRCIKKYMHLESSVVFTGISTGNLGFLCDFKCDELDLFLDKLVNSTPKYDAHRFLEVSYNDKTYFYVNDFAIEKPFGTVKLSISINGFPFENIKGSGLLFATSTGSSAYNRSIGGPLIHNRVSCYLMNEIAPLNNNAYSSLKSPLILSDYDKIKVVGNLLDCYLGGDDTSTIIDEDQLVDINISLSRKAFIFAHYKSTSFYSRIKKGFLGE